MNRLDPPIPVWLYGRWPGHMLTAPNADGAVLVADEAGSIKFVSHWQVKYRDSDQPPSDDEAVA